MLNAREVAGACRKTGVGLEVGLKVTGRGELRAGGRSEMRQRYIIPVVSAEEEARRMSHPLVESKCGGLYGLLKDGEVIGEAAGENAGENALEGVGTIETEMAEMVSWWPVTPPPSTVICSRFFAERTKDVGGARGRVMRRIARSPQAAAISIFFCRRLFGSALSKSSSSSSSPGTSASKSDGRMEAGGNEIWCTGVPRWILYEHANSSSLTSTSDSCLFVASSSSRAIASSSASLRGAFDFSETSLRVFLEPPQARHSTVMPDSWPYTRTSERVVGRDASGRG